MKYRHKLSIKAIAIATTLSISMLPCGALAKDIKGKVVDAATGEPLAGVRIQAYNNEKHTTMSDAKGEYKLTLPDYVTSVYMTIDGRQPQQVSIGNDTDNVNARMLSDKFSQLYDKQTTARRLSTASDFDNNAEQSIDPLIQQRLGADIRAISRGGNEGLGNTMFINGINSLSANAQPLIVIDGVLMDMQYDRTMLHDGYYNNILANINVNDIAKVEVMKNGTAIYGAKGANGVVLITTKRNRSMATKIDVTIGGKFQMMPKTASMLNAEEYRTYATEMLSTEMTNSSGMKFLISDPNYYYYPKYHNNTDWKKETYRDAFAQSYGSN